MPARVRRLPDGYGGKVAAPGIPTLLAGRFRLGALLGRGGMAEVYDGYDERLERPVAVKLVRREFTARDEVVRRFEHEARNAARLVHPNVVAVFDAGHDGGTPFLVMERLPGTTLADRVAEGPLAVDEARRLILDVLAALGAAHRAGIVHRDVKPANVLLDEHGRAKVADFGIAKSLDVDIDLTSTDQVVGTPAYVAPERIAGERATPAADLYAAGLLLYEMLAGTKAFPGDNPLEVAYRVRHDAPPSLAALRPDVPGPLLQAVERAIEKDPARRFASAEEMAAAVAASRAPSGGEDDATIAVAVDGGERTSVLPVAAAPADDPTPVGAGPGHPGAAGGVSTPAHRARGGIAGLTPRRLAVLLGAAAVLVLLLVLASVALRSGGSSPGAGDLAPNADPPASTATTPDVTTTTATTATTATRAAKATGGPAVKVGKGHGKDRNHR